MRLIVSRTKRYGGITSFLLNYLENQNINTYDILLLSSEIDKDIVRGIEEKYNCSIVFFPEYFEKFNLIFKRFLQSIYIKKVLRKRSHIVTTVFVDWNLILDFFTHTSKNKFVSFVHTYPTKEIPKYFKPIINFIIRNTTVITVSKFSAKKIATNWGIHSNEIKVLYNYSHLPGSKIARQLPRKKINVVTIAHCESYKNPHLWLEVASEVSKQNRNVFFHWYGDGTLYSEFLKLTKDNNNIIFHGYSSEISEILSEQATLYLQCSQIESLGISILDAMNYSLPVIVTNNGGMPELVINNENGYVCDSKEEIVRDILKLTSSDEKYSIMANKSKERYESLFSKKNWLNSLKEIEQTPVESGIYEN